MKHVEFTDLLDEYLYLKTAVDIGRFDSRLIQRLDAVRDEINRRTTDKHYEQTKYGVID